MVRMLVEPPMPTKHSSSPSTRFGVCGLHTSNPFFIHFPVVDGHVQGNPRENVSLWTGRVAAALCIHKGPRVVEAE